ncbi:mRNA triphosphatase CET1 [Macrolepiota fuliginosa MF-IS2]|uniref:mRNA-capping enzyme subunit beta n=1 Tax=Macrolepiota fuliginosa MF-IS2 TaxID=1400762 RepID=A0A9P6C3D1_9AGAR|nr:mRNA triphosphatase CET1 [Macrolepiota fuliginosa MF-IS2]
MVLPATSAPRTDSPPPLKRSRHTDMDPYNTNGSQNPSQSHSHTTTGSLPPLSLSILGVEPLDEFIKEIADFVHHMIIVCAADYPAGNIEVEAKVGVLKDKATGKRLQMPVLVETILRPDSMDVRFESNMSAQQHRHFNSLLNNLTGTSNQPSRPAGPLHHTHQYLKDSFFPPDPNSSSDREKIRVTRDEKEGKVTECIHKIRLGDLNIYSPKRNADWRVSVSLEVPKQHPIGTATHTRKKDRLSYSHEEFNIDLTQVTSSTSAAAPAQKLHELELEIARPDLLRSTAVRRGDERLPEHERSAFDELIRAFVNNARILVRNAIDEWQ